MAEWLSRKTRNLVPSGAQVRVLLTSSFFLLVLIVGGLVFGVAVVVVMVMEEMGDSAGPPRGLHANPQQHCYYFAQN
jgi:hypothetical protein